MKRVRALMSVGGALTLVSAIVFAAPAGQVEEGAYKNVLLSGTTIVAGYPDPNDFYVVSEEAKPKLLAELDFHRQTDKAIALAQAHDKTHRDIRLSPNVVFALNDKLAEVKNHYSYPVKEMTLSLQKEEDLKQQQQQLAFKAYPVKRVTVASKEEKQAARDFAIRVANRLTHSKFANMKLEKNLEQMEKSVVAPSPVVAKANVSQKLETIKIGRQEIAKPKIKLASVQAQTKKIKTRGAQAKKASLAKIQHKPKLVERKVTAPAKKVSHVRAKSQAMEKLMQPHAFVPSAKVKKAKPAHHPLKTKAKQSHKLATTGRQKIVESHQPARVKFVVKEFKRTAENKLTLVAVGEKQELDKKHRS